MSSPGKKFIATVVYGMLAITWWSPRFASAESIKDLVEDPAKKGVLTVGLFTFTFTDKSVSGDRTWEEVNVATVGNNGVEFTINPQLRLDSKGEGVAKNLSIEISYTVSATRLIGGATLENDAFAQFAANGASAGVTESLGVGTLYVGNPKTDNVPKIRFDGVMMLNVVNQGKLYTPPRGPGENQDEAQLTSITNTFGIVPEPSTLALAGLGGIGLAIRVARRRRISIAV